jgi:transcriptional regulator with XRE-family HTH domain
VSAGAILSDARRQAGLSQRELARRAGTSQAAIARIETGRQDPSLGTLERLLAACGLELRVTLAPRDRHDEGLMESMVRLGPEDRLRSLEEEAAFFAAARRV